MKIKLTILILTMICVSVLVPAGSLAQDAYPPPETPPGHVIGGNEGNGRVPAVLERETKERLEKPKPTPAPYPEPVLEGNAYIPPEQGQGLPGITDPVFTDDDPRFGVPYVWGIFFSNDGKRRVFVTIELGYPAFDMVGAVCIMSTAAPFAVSCFDLHPRYYNGENGYTTYTSDEIRHCGRFVIQAADLDDIPADIREPNLYVLTCVFLPWLRRFIY